MDSDFVRIVVYASAIAVLALAAFIGLLWLYVWRARTVLRSMGGGGWISDTAVQED